MSNALENAEILSKKTMLISSLKIRKYCRYLRHFQEKIVALFSNLKIGIFRCVGHMPLYFEFLSR